MIKLLKKLTLLYSIQMCLGFVFLSAALVRIILPSIAVIELETLGLPLNISNFIIFFEIICGLSLIFNIYVKYSLLFLILSMISAIIFSIYKFPEIIFNLSELFIFNPTPTDILLHLFYLILMLFILKLKF
tara:strand:+ start:321 stop:713 length:393 start_codon:yes stop_codon:yes gene_type:complete